MDIDVIAENLTELLTNTVNMTDVFYDVFLNPTPMDVSLQQYNSDNQLITVTIPNRAKDRKIALTGTVAPEGSVSANVGTAYVNTVTQKVYFKVSGSGNTGWVYVVDSYYVDMAVEEAIEDGGFITISDLANYLNVNGYVKGVDLAPIYTELNAKANNTAVVHKTGNETVAGNKTFTGSTTINNTLGVTGNTTLGGTLGVTGNTTLDGTLGVTGNTTLDGTFTVNSNSTLTGNINCRQGISFYRGSGGSSVYELSFTQSNPAGGPLIKINSSAVNNLYIQKYGDNNNYKVISSQDLIGIPIPTLSNTLGDDEIWLEGAMVSKTTYAKLYSIYGDDYGTSTSTQFKLPDFRDRVMWGIGSDGSWGYIAAGLPNIEGSLNNVRYLSESIATKNGVFSDSTSYQGALSNFWNDSQNTSYGTVDFKASNSNTIYSDSVTTVQPPAIKVRFKTKFK